MSGGGVDTYRAFVSYIGQHKQEGSSPLQQRNETCLQHSVQRGAEGPGDVDDHQPAPQVREYRG